MTKTFRSTPMTYKVAHIVDFKSIVDGKETKYNSAMVFYSEKEGEDHVLQRLRDATSKFFSEEYTISAYAPISFSNANENYLFYLRERFDFPIHRVILRKVEMSDSLVYNKDFPVMACASKENAVVVREDLKQVYAYFPYSWGIHSGEMYNGSLYEVLSKSIVDAINQIQKEDIDDIDNNETDSTREEVISKVVTKLVQVDFPILNKQSELEIVIKEFFK